MMTSDNETTNRLAAVTLAFLESIEWKDNSPISSFTCPSCFAVVEIRGQEPIEWTHAPDCRLKLLIDKCREILSNGTESSRIR